jgi:hypothetical protein
LNNAAYFNDIYTMIGGKAEPESNHQIFKGNNHDIMSIGAKGPTWIATGPHNDVQLNRSAWSALGFVYSFGEVRGKCGSGGSRTGKVCLIPSGNTATLGCPSATCNPNPVLLNAGGGHGYFANNFLHSDQKGPTAGVPGGLAAYVGVTPWGGCDNTSDLPYKTCSTGGSDATTGCPGSDYAAAGVACALTGWADILFNNNEFYAIQEGVTGFDLSGATMLYGIGNLNFDGNLLTAFNGSPNTTGFKGPTNAIQLQNANIASHFDRTLVKPIDNFDWASGTTQNSTGLQAANDQGTVITLEADSQISKYNLVQPSTTNSSKVVKTLTTTPGATIGVALNDTVTNPSGACTTSLVAGTSTYANSTTYYFVYTWATASGETLQSSECSRATDGTASNDYIRVVANGGTVPAGAYAMKVYVGSVTGGPYYYSTSVVGHTVDTTTPPNTANLQPPTVSTATQVRVMTSGITNCVANTGAGAIVRGDYLTGDSSNAGQVKVTAAGALPVIGKALAPCSSCANGIFRCSINGGSGAIASGGVATSLSTGNGTNGSRGITLYDNTTDPSSPSASSTFLHSMGGFLYGMTPSDNTPGGYLPPTQFKRVSTQQDFTSNTIAAITALSGFKMAASGKYMISGRIMFQTSATATDSRWGWDVSATTSSSGDITLLCNDGATTAFELIQLPTRNTHVVQDTPQQTVNTPCLVSGYIQNGTSNGTFEMKYARDNASTGTASIMPNSFIKVERVP